MVARIFKFKGRYCVRCNVEGKVVTFSNVTRTKVLNKLNKDLSMKKEEHEDEEQG